MNFQRLEEKINVNHKDDIYPAIKKLGYDYLSEFVFDQYYNKGRSTRKIGWMIDVTQFPILYVMKKLGFQRRPLGGNNVNPILNRPGINEKILSLKGTMSGRAAAQIIGCSKSKIQNIWANHK